MWFRILVIICVLGLAEYYSYILIRSSVRNMPAIWRSSITVLYISLTLLSWMGFIFFRQINAHGSPHLLRNLYIAFVLGFVIGKLLAMILMFADDARRVVTWVIESVAHRGTVTADLPKGIQRSEFMKSAAILIAGVSILGFAYGIRNRYNYQVRRLKLVFDDLPAAFKGLKIVQISDIHTGSFDDHAAVAHGIQLVMDQKPDLILFTGDLVNNLASEVDAQYMQLFSQLKAPMGVYSTLGNHDYGDYISWASEAEKGKNLLQLIDTHAAMGWRLLMNEHVILERGEDKIALIGIENWSDKAHFPKYGDMKKAYSGLKEKNIPFKILMSHDPSHWNAQVRPEYPDIQLTLSGHTHGMQFGVDSKWLKWSPIQYMYEQWAGLYEEGSQYLHVNRGFGFLGYPGRLGILPEITVFELG